jgi:hypothetical protein
MICRVRWHQLHPSSKALWQEAQVQHAACHIEPQRHNWPYLLNVVSGHGGVSLHRVVWFPLSLNA